MRNSIWTQNHLSWLILAFLFLFFYYYYFFSSINVFCSSMVSVVVILISCQTVWSLWGVMSITDLRFQADPSALGHSFIPYVKTFGCWTELVPEFQWIMGQNPNDFGKVQKNKRKWTRPPTRHTFRHFHGSPQRKQPYLQPAVPAQEWEAPAKLPSNSSTSCAKGLIVILQACFWFTANRRIGAILRIT